MSPRAEFQRTVLLVERIILNINRTVGLVDHRWVPFDCSVPVLVMHSIENLHGRAVESKGIEHLRHELW